MRRGIIIILCVLVTLPGILTAQDFSFTASVNKNTIGSNETLKLTFTANNASPLSHVVISSLPDWQIVSGPSTQNTVNIIQGRRTMSYSEVFVLRPTKEGKLTIPEATLKTDKGTLASKPIVITVVKGTAPSTPGSPPQPSSSGSSDFFVELELSKSKVFVGEPVLAVYRFYSAYDPRQLEKTDYPKLDGFWSEEIETPIDVEITLINGRKFFTAPVKRQLLFPQTAGTLVIDGFALDMIVSSGDHFFFRQNQRVSGKAKKVTLEVLPYPAGKPGNFLGTYDPLSMNVSVDVHTLKTNEAINLKVTYSGNGNLKLIDDPEFEFPGDFEVFEPKTRDNISIGAGGESGSRTFEYILIPRVPGDFTIPAVTQSYFDPGSRSYKTLTTEALDFHVEKGDGNNSGNYTFDSRTDVQILSQDIRFIKPDAGELRPRGTVFMGSIPYYGMVFLPFILLAVVVASRRKKDHEEKDIAGTYRRKAGKEARKQLAAARKFHAQGNRTAFTQELFRALNQYISHKLSIPPAALNKTAIRDHLRDKWHPTDIENMIALIEECEFARFAGNTTGTADDLLQRAEAMIEKMESTYQ